EALTAVVPAFDNMVGTQLSVTWTGTPGGGSHTTVPVTVTTQGPQSVPLPNSVVAFNLGKPVTVIYTIVSNGTPKDSKPLLLAVQPIAHGDPQLGMPLITQAANGGEGPDLDVSQLTENATMRVNSWPLIALRQYVWLELEGTKKDDSVYAKTFWQPPTGTTNDRWISQGYFTHPLPLADLQNLKDGSELKVVFKAGLSGSQAVGEAISFPVRTYTVVLVAAGGYEDWTNEVDQYLERPVTFKSGLEFTPLSFVDRFFLSYSLALNRRDMHCRGLGSARFKWTGTVTNIELLIYRPHPAHKISFFDINGNLLEQRSQPEAPTGDVIFEYQAPSGKRISYFEVNNAEESLSIPRYYLVAIRWFNS
ncbi:hypothetical protein HU755_26840, partial [Pseudomonas sp. SWRI111]|nr:hypothetical protein [Pseudomonas sp. SWRI111]